MCEFFSITSAQNERFKLLRALREKKARIASQTFLVEGQKEITSAVKNGFIIEGLWVIESQCLRIKSWIEAILSPASEGGSRLYSLPEALFNKVGYREKTEGVVAVVQFREPVLADIVLTDSALVIVADQLEKPCNIGTLFRIADGVGAGAVILAGLSSDAYNPNVIRNSVGTFFTVPFAVAEPADIVTWFITNNLTPVVASPVAKQGYHELNWPTRTALIVGREHEGIQSNWGKAALQTRIPMYGQNDSLNVAVSTGILAYAWRQHT